MDLSDQLTVYIWSLLVSNSKRSTCLTSTFECLTIFLFKLRTICLCLTDVNLENPVYSKLSFVQIKYVQITELSVRFT